MQRPLYRGQGNQPFYTNVATPQSRRGQTVPYDINGSPTVTTPPPGALNISIVDLPLANVAEPLVRFRLTRDYLFTTGVADATIGATGSPVFRLRKNGVASGTVTFAGTVGTLAWGDSTYPSGALFELYPPVTPDATLDQVSITLKTA